MSPRGWARWTVFLHRFLSPVSVWGCPLVPLTNTPTSHKLDNWWRHREGCPQERECTKAQIKAKGQSVCIHHLSAVHSFPPICSFPTLSPEEATMWGVKMTKKMATLKSKPTLQHPTPTRCYRHASPCSASWDLLANNCNKTGFRLLVLSNFFQACAAFRAF